MTDSKRLEKEFKIEIIASIIENKILTLETHPKKIEEFENEILEFCQFITGETVTFGNLYRFGPIISTIVREQYPNMIRLTSIGRDDLNVEQIKYLIRHYKIIYGETIKIKSIKKGMIKTLKNTNK